MTILSIFKPNLKLWWKNTKQNLIGWEVLLLFAIGLTVLLVIMGMMPYPLVNR